MEYLKLFLWLLFDIVIITLMLVSSFVICMAFLLTVSVCKFFYNIYTGIKIYFENVVFNYIKDVKEKYIKELNKQRLKEFKK